MMLPPSRVEALLAHEVGTHLLTYYNGRLQPFQQLYSGLAGYEELQEGLAVLSEYLVGGLSCSPDEAIGRPRGRGASLDRWSFLCRDISLADRRLWFCQATSLQHHDACLRGGGFTKDAVYLRGLVAILQYVKQGGDLNPLLVGKMAVEHIPIIKELQYRKVLKAAPITPRYLQNPESLARLERLKAENLSVIDLVADSHSENGVSS